MGEKLKFNGVLINKEEDPRNYTIAMFVPGKDVIEDEEFCLKLPELDIILNQKQFGSCVGHAFAMAKSILEYNRTNKWIDIDPYAIYGTRYSGDYTGVGMHAQQGAKVLLKDGAFLRRDFGIQQEVPQLINTLKEWKLNNPDKVKEAKNLAISAYYFVNNDVDIKKSLKNGMPVSATYPIYDNFYETGNDGVVSMHTNKNKLDGYHQMTIIGWTKKNQWIVVNSWGTDSGLKGIYLIPFKYRYTSAIAVSDTITPVKYKSKEIEFIVGSKYFKVDGVEKEFDTIPFVKNNRTYVPVRFITESLGASVEWLADTQEIIIRSEECKLKLQIGNKKFVINDEDIDWNDVAPELVNSRTMLPIRLIAEYLNCKVLWEDGIVKIKAL